MEIVTAIAEAGVSDAAQALVVLFGTALAPFVAAWGARKIMRLFTR